MAANINDFRNFTEFVSNKAQVGNSLTVTQFNDVAHRAQMQVFEKDRAIFIAKEICSDYLKTFLITTVKNGPFAAGEIPMPDNLEHITSVRSYHIKSDGLGMEVPVQEVKNKYWGEVTSSSLFSATSRFPKYTEFNGHLRVLPINTNNITIDYFRTPIKPIWAYTTVNGRPVYDSSSSTNFEWEDFALNNVAAYFLQMVGVNLKDGELLNFTQQYKQETNSLL